MYTFKDRGDRDICLVPEATALIQEEYNKSWKLAWPKPCRVFYVQRCYRYEKPQKGRYREFTQVGVELLGNKAGDKEEVVQLLKDCLALFPVESEFKDAVKRGLTYYVEDGFEVEIASLGAQKQVAGGGRYAEGIGWAIGLDRLLVALTDAPKPADEVVLASGVTEKGRMYYRMYEERFGKKHGN